MENIKLPPTIVNYRWHIRQQLTTADPIGSSLFMILQFVIHGELWIIFFKHGELWK